jgi:hypothetical protein
MARQSILSDELVRQLVAVGQVDILVGVPTHNNAATIQSVVTNIHVGLAKHFPRERTVLINPDTGSEDGTADLVVSAPMAEEEARGSSTLRTTHRVSARAGGLPGIATGVRTLFAAADLLQAKVVVLVDAHVQNLSPAWLGDLAGPIWRDEADLTLPIRPRHRFDGALLNQLVRPLLGTAYRRHLRAGTIGGFGCSGRLAAPLVQDPLWEGAPGRPSVDVAIVATALAEDARLCQVYMGFCDLAPDPTRPGLADLFRESVGTVFSCLHRQASAWLARQDAREVAVIGVPHEPTGQERTVDLVAMSERFRMGVRDLEPLLRDILTAETLAQLHETATAGDGVPAIADPLWVTTVFEFAASAHRAVMNREHLAQALVPLYLGRTASFFAEIASADEAARSERLAALEREYEQLRPYLVERWNAGGGR